jgi:NADPH-dependent curcumin reductase
MPTREPQNRQFRLAARPQGLPRRSDWSFITAPVQPPGAGEVLVRVLYISLDPAMRGWMHEGKSYIPPVQIGAVMRALGLGRVVRSQSPDFREGDIVTGAFGVQDYATLPAREVHAVPPGIAPLPAFLGVLGMPGITAYFGLLEIGRPVKGETVVVSGAAGAVGAVVGQIARIAGCRAVGIAGGPEKCRYLTEELGFDAAIDRHAEDVRAALERHCPDGINIYFDNVGGPILDDCLALLALHARVVLCGAISQYNSTGPIKGPSNYISLLINRARMEGMVVFDYMHRAPEALRAIGQWIVEGRIKHREDIVEGVENFPEAFLRLFSGENFGKLVLRVTAE